MKTDIFQRNFISVEKNYNKSLARKGGGIAGTAADRR